jgi:ABC-type bacteriocin/lantibiotic exporter with double-glycine peptidase domain
MESFFKKKHVWIVPVYGIFYMFCFRLLEREITHGYHIIHVALDDMIPFCEIFIIPYFLWFAYMGVVIVYFAFFNKNVKEFYQVFLSLGIGMTIFLVVSWLYPNGQNLRPMVFPRHNVFVDMVRHLYATDTPTNILPSLHVYNSVASCIAFNNCKKLKEHRRVRTGVTMLTFLIVLSTMFLKQHSVFDVVFAFALNAIVYFIMYQPKFNTQTGKEDPIKRLLEN